MHPDTLLFFQAGLDPNSRQELTLTNTDDRSGILSINSITVYRESVSSTIGSSRDQPSYARYASNITLFGMVLTLFLQVTKSAHRWDCSGDHIGGSIPFSPHSLPFAEEETKGQRGNRQTGLDSCLERFCRFSQRLSWSTNS